MVRKPVSRQLYPRLVPLNSFPTPSMADPSFQLLRPNRVASSLDSLSLIPYPIPSANPVGWTSTCIKNLTPSYHLLG